MTNLTQPNTPLPPEGCICASFWTVRQKHKSDCPCNTPESEIKDLIVGSLEWKILKILQRVHSAKECPQRGDCLTHELATDRIVALIRKDREAVARKAKIDELHAFKEIGLSPTGLLDSPGLTDKMPFILWVINDRIDNRLADLNQQQKGGEDE